jgi:DNA-binding CsgD family transcriptional regulator
VVAWAHQYLGVVDTKTGELARGIELLDLSYREGIDLGDDVLAETALFNACVSRQLALRAGEVGTRLTSHRGAAGGSWPLMRDSVWLGALVDLGDISGGLDLTEHLRPRLAAAGAGALLEWADCGRAILLAEAGRFEEARALLRGSLDGLEGQDLAMHAAVRIRYLLVSGDVDGAAAVAINAGRRHTSPGVNHRFAAAVSQALFAAGLSAELDELGQLIAADPGLADTAWGHQLAGLVSLAGGDHAEASRRLQTAMREFDTASYRLHHARCAAMLGIVVGGTEGDRLIDGARDRLAVAGASGTLTEIDALISRRIGPRAAAPGLTRREVDVLTLLAAGRTDLEIANALYISLRTVTSHLDRIRDKTGRRRRADLTRLAFEVSQAR